MKPCERSLMGWVRFNNSKDEGEATQTEVATGEILEPAHLSETASTSVTHLRALHPHNAVRARP
jgi:hypothetical protein